MAAFTPRRHAAAGVRGCVLLAVARWQDRCMQLTALILSLLAFAVSLGVARQQLSLARHANSLPVLTAMFKEHRDPELADVRSFLHQAAGTADPTMGFAAFGDRRQGVLQLAWYYDNLGALVAHDVIDVAPVAGYLGGAMLDVWRILEPFIITERASRSSSPDAGRWQQYFENLAVVVRGCKLEHERQPTRSCGY